MDKQRLDFMPNVFAMPRQAASFAALQQMPIGTR
jgi:hypothetical protein